MQHKWIVIFTALVLLSSLLAPAGAAQAQGGSPDCPPYEDARLNDQDFRRSLPPECIESYQESARQASLAANARDGQPMATSIPDRFGYTYDDSVAYNWISATTNSGLTGENEFMGSIEIGFSFPFYGVPQSQLYFSTNGLITFDGGSWEQGYYDIQFPDEVNPNHFIAPFWDHLLVGSPYNNGAIYYSQGGTAPNRYFVVEWRNVEDWYTSSTFSFEAILYENGDILFQYQSVPSIALPGVGIEDSLGYSGLMYDLNYLRLDPGKSIQFYYPDPAARLQVSPALSAGKFAPLGGYTDFDLTVTNSGGLGADTYDLTLSSPWPVTFYAANGMAPLTDTDADTVIDTGPIPEGTSKTVVARFSTPPGAQIGDSNPVRVTFKSSLNSSKTRRVYLFMSVPAGFVNVFQDEADGAMNFMTANPYAANIYTVSPDNYFAYGTAVTQLPNGNYFYAWHHPDGTETSYWGDIEFTVLDPHGNVMHPITKLTDNAGATLFTDLDPSVAVAPNGVIGVAWYRRLENSSNQFNYNIYFATLDASGNLLTDPTSITNNTSWGTGSELGFLRLDDPTITATEDNRFVIGWDSRQRTDTDDVYSIWFAIQSSTGASLLSPTVLSSDVFNRAQEPILNSLTGGKVIVTWGPGEGVYYAVIDSDGVVLKPLTVLSPYGKAWTPDAVQLPNGNVAVAWGQGYGDEVGLAILDSSYNLVYGPTTGYYPSTISLIAGRYGLSVTTDPDSHVIMTWNTSNKLFYALGDSNGTFLTEPMIFKTGGNYVYTSWNGQGNAPYKADEVEPDTTSPTVTSILRAQGSPSSAASVGFTVTFSEPVLNVDTTDFALSTSGSITGALITNVTGSGSTRTVTVNTGSGNGTIRLTVPASASITDAAGNPIAGLPFTNGESYTILKAATFSDVETDYWAWQYVERLYNAKITGGCNTDPLEYCPGSTVTRAQMAIFLLKGIHGSSYAPPAVGGDTGFSDVQPTHWAAKWIKQLAVEKITGGCATGKYCPDSAVTRAQMAIFLLKARHGSSYKPPAVGGSTGFSDVPADHWAAAWIKQLAAEGITAGCRNGNYCPDTPVTRAQMAVFLVKTFNLP